MRSKKYKYRIRVNTKGTDNPDMLVGHTKLFPLPEANYRANAFAVFDSMSEATRKIKELQNGPYMQRLNFEFVVERALDRPDEIWIDNEFMINLRSMVAV